MFRKKTILNNIKNYPNILWHSEIKYLLFPSIQNSKIDNKEYNNDFIKNYYIHFCKRT